MSEPKEKQAKPPTEKDLLKEIVSTLQAREADYGSIISKLDALIALGEAIEKNTGATWQRVNDFDATFRNFLDFQKQPPPLPPAQGPPTYVEPPQPRTRQRVTEHEATGDIPIDTEWRTSRNPDIEWCPEQEAVPEDVAKAKDPKDQSMWYRGPQGDYEHGSIFRRRPGAPPSAPRRGGGRRY